MHWGLVLLGLLTTVLTVVLRDDLLRSWAEGRPDLRRVLATQGLQAIKDGAVRPPAFVPVAAVLFVVVSLLIWMLLVFFSNGYNWARLSLTALLFFAAVTTVAGIRTDPPAVFVVLSVASVVIGVVAVAYLWHPDTNRFISGKD
jgi:hypothetical protein